LCGLGRLGSASVGNIFQNPFGSSTEVMSDPAEGSGARLLLPALIQSQGIIRGALRGAYVPCSELFAAALGEMIGDAIGLPEDSALAVLKTRNGSGDAGLGALAVETALEWPI
jgi:hypothetical protein